MKALEQEGSIEFLIYLSRKKKANISEALRDLNVGQSALYSALNKLKKANLITETRKDTFPFSRFFILTEKGKKVAELLAEVERVMKE